MIECQKIIKKCLSEFFSGMTGFMKEIISQIGSVVNADQMIDHATRRHLGGVSALHIPKLVPSETDIGVISSDAEISANNVLDISTKKKNKKGKRKQSLSDAENDRTHLDRASKNKKLHQ